MADKRMFSQKIVESDAFCSLTLQAQALYFHLNMVADDDGVVDSPNRIIRGLCPDDDDKAYKKQQKELKKGLDELIEKRFLIAFPSGVVVIKHWKMQNQVKKDRYKPSNYQEELSTLTTKTNGSYTETNVRQNGDKMETNVLRSIDKYSIGECSIEECSIGECRGEEGVTETHDAAAPDTPSPSLSSSPLFGKYGNVQLTKQELAKLKMTFPKDWAEKIEQMSDYLFYGGKADNHYELMLTFG